MRLTRTKFKGKNNTLPQQIFKKNNKKDMSNCKNKIQRQNNTTEIMRVRNNKKKCKKPKKKKLDN